MSTTPISHSNHQIPGSAGSIGLLSDFSSPAPAGDPQIPGTAETAISAASFFSSAGFSQLNGASASESLPQGLFSQPVVAEPVTSLASKNVTAVSSNTEGKANTHYREGGMRTRQQTGIEAKKIINS